MDAGSLRHRIIIQQQTETQNQDTGAVQISWTDLARVWSSIEPLSSRDFVAAQSEQSKVIARITIRYMAGVTSKMRIHHPAKDIYYNIEGVLSDKDSGLEYLTLPCSSGVRD